MHVPIWSHQISTSYLGAAIGPSDDGQPFSEIWPKTHDGLYLMSTWDVPHRWTINGPEALADFAAYQAENGRNVRPWCVVKGLDPEAEGKLAAQMARAAGSANLTRDNVIIIDLEPYYHGGPGNPQFWRSDLFNDGPARVKRFLDAFAREAGPNSTAWIAADVRAGHLEPVSYEVWAAHPIVSLHTPQTYYTIFDGNANASIARAKLHIDRANALLAGYGVKPGSIGHILPAEGNPDTLIAAYEYCHSLGQQRPSLWQRVNITPENATRLMAARDPWQAPPPPPPPPVPVVGRETRIEPIGPVIFDWTDKDDERVMRARVRLVRDAK